MKKILSLFMICIICCGVHAQRTEVYNQHIHTVQVIANNDYMSPAVIRLGENETVEISFDHSRLPPLPVHPHALQCGLDTFGSFRNRIPGWFQ